MPSACLRSSRRQETPWRHCSLPRLGGAALPPTGEQEQALTRPSRTGHTDSEVADNAQSLSVIWRCR